jgi:hypothetical protein
MYRVKKKQQKGKRGAGQNKGYLNIFIPRANNPISFSLDPSFL